LKGFSRRFLLVAVEVQLKTAKRQLGFSIATRPSVVRAEMGESDRRFFVDRRQFVFVSDSLWLSDFDGRR
jgi:hypothetical protein